MAAKWQNRRGNASEWTATNPVLSAGEIGVELDTDKFKIGDGATAWNTLTYGVTKTLAGLSNVDNTADSAKPVSTPQQTALNLKANVASPTFTGTVSGITKAMVGLGNVDNTSDINKPVSTAQAAAIAAAGGGGGGGFDQEAIEDMVAAMFNGTHSNATVAYNDSTGKLTIGASAGATGNVAWLVRPASTTVDAGALINTALATYGVAILAPGRWALNTQVRLATNQSLLGYGQGASVLVAGTALAGQPMVIMDAGDSSHVTIDGLKLDAMKRASECIYMYATATPDTAGNTSPDFVHTIHNVHAHNATGDNVYIGGSNAFSGNCRETRIRWLLTTNAGAYGLRCESSDMFVSDVTSAHNASTGGGIIAPASLSGNLKLMHCKAYFERIGIDASGGRISIVGGEVQDCDTGIRIGNDGYVACVIDTCGTATTPALVVAGGGCTFATHITSRPVPGGGARVITAAVQFTTSSVAHGGFISTNVARAGANDYTAVYLGTGRPTNSTVVVA